MRARVRLPAFGLIVAAALAAAPPALAEATLQSYALPKGAAPHDVAPTADGAVWYTAQSQGALGRLDPKSGKAEQVALGEGSAPHGVIVGPDGALWVTDGGLNAIVRLDPATLERRLYKLPAGDDNANLNTATFDRRGRLWFTGQNGYYGVLELPSGEVRVFAAPKGVGPYGMTTTPDGGVFYASLAGNYLGRIALESGKVEVIEPPTPHQGARRVWSDAKGGVWLSEWNAGKIARFAAASGQWRTWKVPGQEPQPYAIYVDETGKVWLSDFGANALWRFDPADERFERFALPHANASVRQLAGRTGEVWGAESRADYLVVVRFR